MTGFLDVADGGAHARRIREVQMKRPNLRAASSKGSHGGFTGLKVARPEKHRNAKAGKLASDRQTDAPVTAGDEGRSFHKRLRLVSRVDRAPRPTVASV